MTNQTVDKASSGRVKVLGNALLLIIPMAFRWIAVSIKSINKPPEKKTEMFWDMIANYVDNVSGNEGLKQIDIRSDEKIRKYLKNSDVILDYGCGDGILALKYAGLVKEIRGIDYSHNMVEVAKKKAAEANIENIHFTQAVIFDERLERGSYDVVLARGVLHLLDDRLEVVDRIYELLKPGGLFISLTECLDEKKTSVASVLSFLMKIRIFPPILKFFTVQELEDTVTSANLQLVEAEILVDNPVAYFIAAEKD